MSQNLHYKRQSNRNIHLTF